MKRIKRMKQIVAWIGIIFLVSLYLITFILGVFGSPRTQGLFMGCLVCTVVVPVLIYAMMLIAKRLENADKDLLPPAKNPAEEKEEKGEKQA